MKLFKPSAAIFLWLPWLAISSPLLSSNSSSIDESENLTNYNESADASKANKTQFIKIAVNPKTIQAEATAYKSNLLLQKIVPAANSSVKLALDLNLPNTKGITFDKFRKLLNILEDVFSVVDAASGVVNLAFLFVPKGDSAELAYMKKQFDIVNDKLDRVVQGQVQVNHAVEFLDLTKHINVAFIRSLHEKYLDLLEKMTRNQTHLDAKFMKEFEDFTLEIQRGQLLTMTQSLIWSITDPAKTAFGITENFFQLYLKKVNHDCSALQNLVPELIQLLRQSRQVLDFYYRTQLGMDAPIDWQIDAIFSEICDELKHCMEDPKVKLDLAAANDHHQDFLAFLHQKYLVYEWAVLTFTEGQDIFVTSDDYAQANQKVAVFVPFSRRSNVAKTIKDEIETKISDWCKDTRQVLGGYHDKADQFAEILNGQISQYSRYIHTMILVHRIGTANAEGFDINLSCDKLKEKVLWTTVTFQVSIVLKNAVPDPANEPCSHGKKVPVTKMGSEAFCSCHTGYFGATCQHKINHSHDLQNSTFLATLTDNLQVPGMFALVDLLQSASEQLHMEHQQTRSFIANQTKAVEYEIQRQTQGLKTSILDESTKKSREILDQLQSLNVTNQQLLKGLVNFFEDKAFSVEGTYLESQYGLAKVIDKVLAEEIKTQRIFLQGNCELIKEEHVGKLRPIDAALKEYATTGTSHQARQIFFRHFFTGYWTWRTEQIPALVRSIKGDRYIIDSPSLTEREMRCFDQDDYCQYNYHTTLRRFENTMMDLYFKANEFEKEAMKFTTNKTYFSEQKIESDYQESLKEIPLARRARSCPGFSNLDLKGQGCQNISTFQGQNVKLQCLQKDSFPTLVFDNGTFIPIPNITCLGDLGKLHWSHDPQLIQCINSCQNHTRPGSVRNLPSMPGMKWVNATQHTVNVTKCMVFQDESTQRFYAQEEQVDLVDRDECNEDPNICGPNGLCLDNNIVAEGIPFRCACEDGYENPNGNITQACVEMAEIQPTQKPMTL